jgi:microcystin-dependent protein
MPEAFLGEVKIFTGIFAPREWAFCDGLIIEMECLDCISKQEFGSKKNIKNHR